MYLDRKFVLKLSLSEITLLFDLSLYLDQTLAQRKAKSKVKVAQWALTSHVAYGFVANSQVYSHQISLKSDNIWPSYC